MNAPASDAQLHEVRAYRLPDCVVAEARDFP